MQRDGGYEPIVATRQAGFHEPDGESPTADCAVCLEPLSGADVCDSWGSAHPCGHVFHEKCLLSWLERSHRCPLCREPLCFFLGQFGRSLTCQHLLTARSASLVRHLFIDHDLLPYLEVSDNGRTTNYRVAETDCFFVAVVDVRAYEEGSDDSSSYGLDGPSPPDSSDEDAPILPADAAPILPANAAAAPAAPPVANLSQALSSARPASRDITFLAATARRHPHLRRDIVQRLHRPLARAVEAARSLSPRRTARVANSDRELPPDPEARNRAPLTEDALYSV